MKRYGVAIGALTLLGVVVFGGQQVNRLAATGAAYKSKTVCSEVFLGGRSEEDVLEAEFTGLNDILKRISATVDEERKSVVSSLFGLGKTRAVFREGYGCTIVRGGAPEMLPALAPIEDQPWPTAGPSPTRTAIDGILQVAFENNNVGHRGVAVFVDGALVSEAYAEGFDRNSPFLSWSMAKSVTATMIGAAVEHDVLDLDARPPLDAWSRDGDPRQDVSWTHLLQMQSGLDFAEDYADPVSDVNTMLWQARSTAAAAVQPKLAHEPGSHWSYSSGTSNILQHALHRSLDASGASYHRFAHDALFTHLGMASAVLEPDAAGDFVGSSFMYATARDWAKLGQLYLQDGVWKGKRLLPAGWRDFVRAPASASDGQYGAQFWLNFDGEDRKRYIKGLPEDIYYMAGHEGQYVLIIPDANAVIVRFGRTTDGAPIEANAPLFEKLYQALKSQ